MDKELIEDLHQWLESRHIQYKIFEDELHIDGFDKMQIFDTDKVTSVFKRPKGTDNVVLNNYEVNEELIEDGIFYACLKFGLNWYYVDLREEPDLKILQCIGKRSPSKCKHPFVNLGVHTSYDLMTSSVHIDELVKYTSWFGHSSVGICDTNTMAATYPLQKLCKGVKGIFGYTTTVLYEDLKIGCKLYVKNQEGLHNLLRIQKIINVDRLDGFISFDEIKPYASDLFFVFSKETAPILSGQNGNGIIELFMDVFGEENVFYQFDVSEYKTDMLDTEMLNHAKDYINNIYLNEDAIWIPPVLISDVYYLEKEDSKSRITLQKIKLGGAHNQSLDQYFKDVDDHYSQLKPLFDGKVDDYGFDFEDFFLGLCENVMYIADNCNAKFDNDRMFMPVYPMTDEEVEKYGDKLTMFDSIIEEGFERLVPKDKVDIYRDRLEKEKYVLKSTNSVDYFLIYYDLCNWSRKNDVLTAYGRGSAGGCLISYLMGIIKIDPIRYNLIFERFLIPERAGLNNEECVKLTPLHGDEFYEIESEEGIIRLACDSTVIVERDGDKLTICIKDVIDGDNILFDNIHEVWDIEYKK